MRRSLKYRLMLWNAGVVLLTAIATLVGVREGARYTLYHEMDQRLIEDLYEVELGIAAEKVTVADMQSARGGETPARVVQALEELNRKARGHVQHGWFVHLLDPQGEELWVSENTPSVRPAMPEVPDFAPVTVGSHRLVESRQTGGAFSPLVVRIGLSNDFIAEDMARIDRLVAIAAAIVLVVAIAGGYWLAGRAIRPLAALISTAARLRPRQLDERLPIRGTGDELDQLSLTINGLLDRIASYLSRKHDFLANSAHELRTPIAAIRSTVEVALGGNRSTDEYEELLVEVIDQCSSLETLVNQLLLLAETDSESLDMHGERVDLARIVARSVDMFQGVAEFQNVDLRTSMLPSLSIDGNAHYLRQVLNNLLDNALKYTPAGGTVTVELQGDDKRHQAVLTVRDTGIGIPAGDLPHVFERFYRVDKSRSHAAEVRGTGLGLSICQAVVFAHGGQIFVESDPGRGTVFTILLPLARDEARPVASGQLSTVESGKE